MVSASLACYVAVMLSIGYATLSAIYGGAKRGLVEVVGLSLALGAGNMGLLLFFASLAGFVPSRPLFACLGAGAGIVIFILWRFGRLVRPSLAFQRIGRGEWWCVIPALLLGCSFVAVALHALAIPLYEWDAFCIWGLKAKVLINESLRSNPSYFHDRSLEWSHLTYPLLLPFLTSGIYGVLGCVDDRLGKLVPVLIYIAMSLVIYSALRWKLSRPRALCLLALQMAMPSTIWWAGSGNADLALALFHGAAVFFLARWLEEDDGRDLLLSALFAAFAAFTKNEGQALALADGAVLLLFSLLPFNRLRLARTGLFAAVVAALALPWFLWSRGLPHTDENYSARISLAAIVSNLPKAGIVAREFAAQAVTVRQWGFVWVLLALSGVFCRRAWRRACVRALWALLAAQLAIYAAVYLVTSWDVEELLRVTLDRVPLHATPLAILLIGYHWASTAE